METGRTLGLALSTQFSDQQSVGDNRLTGEPFHTAQGGVALDVSYRNAVLTVAFTSTDSGRDMISPWSSYPGFTSCQVRDFNRAGKRRSWSSFPMISNDLLRD